MANKLTSIDVTEIVRQSDILSKNVRDNFTNIKNKTNELVDEIAAAAIGTTNAETTAARPYHTNLKERLDNKNITPTGGAVTVNGADVTKVDVTQFLGTIEGIDVKVSATTSAAVSAAAATKHRVDVVCAQTDNSFVIVTGPESLKASTDPVFPTIATTQYELAAIYVDDGAVDHTGNIYALRKGSTKENYYLKQAATLNQGRYDFNNLIVDAAITLDFTDTTNYYRFQRQIVIIKCDGNFYNTSNGTFAYTSPHNITVNAADGSAGSTDGTAGATTSATITGFSSGFISFASGKGGDGGAGRYNVDCNGGGGGSAGSSVINDGGAGGAGGTVGVGGGGGGTTGDGAKGTAIVSRHSFLFIKGYNINISADIDMDGVDGADGSDGAGATAAAGGGGSGASGGGNLFLIGDNDITVNAGVTVSCDGGTGGNGGDSSSGSDKNAGGGGGGGGGGGLLLIRSLSYTNNGTVTAAGGGAGAGGTASGGGVSNVNGSAGTAGSAGIVDQAIYDDLSTAITDGKFPINVFGLDIV